MNYIPMPEPPHIEMTWEQAVAIGDELRQRGWLIMQVVRHFHSKETYVIFAEIHGVTKQTLVIDEAEFDRTNLIYPEALAKRGNQ